MNFFEKVSERINRRRVRIWQERMDARQYQNNDQGEECKGVVINFFEKISERINRRRERIWQERMDAGQCPNHGPGEECMECASKREHIDGCQCYYCRPYK